MTYSRYDTLDAVHHLDREIARLQREDQITRDGIVSVNVPDGCEILMEREDLDARIDFLRRNDNSYNKKMVAELKRLVAEQAGRDLDRIGMPR